MKKRNIKLRKLGSIGNRVEGYNTLYIRRATEMNMINRSQKQGCLMQKKRLKTIRKGI